MLHDKIAPKALGGPEERRIAQLDGWRGISILLVVVGHLVNTRYSDFPVGHPTNWTYQLSIVGVDIFFVISGFIITKLALRQHQEAGRFFAGAFYLRRFFRIVPPLALFLASVWGATEFGMIQLEPRNIFIAAVFACNIPRSNCDWFTDHTWSLAYEEQFYLFFPLLFMLRITRIKTFLVAVLVLLMALPFIAYVFHLSEAAKQAATVAERGFPFICAGAVVAAYIDKIRRFTLSRWASLASWCAVATAISIVWFQTLASPPASPLAYLCKGFAITLLPVCLAWLVGSSVFLSNFFTRLLGSQPLQYFGMISYSWYLWQQMFSAYRTRYVIDSWLLFPPLALLLATLSYYLLKQPCIRLGKRLLGVRANRFASLKTLHREEAP